MTRHPRRIRPFWSIAGALRRGSALRPGRKLIEGFARKTYIARGTYSRGRSRMAAKRDAVAAITLRPIIENSEMVPVRAPEAGQALRFSSL